MIAPLLSADSYLEDASGLHGEAERAFVPENTSELRELVCAAVAQRIPITIMGAGTGLTGGAVPYGGWVVSLNRFRGLEIRQGAARCGVGLSLQDLQDEAAKSGQFFGPNPTEHLASIGGMVATNAGGARSFGFRSVRHHVLGMEVTFMDGETRWINRGDPVPFTFTPVHQPETTKNSAGYFLQPGADFVSLLAGSEGTLGIITEVELRLMPVAPAILSGVVFFSSDEDALDAVDEWRPVPGLRLMEYLDAVALGFLRTPYPEIPAAARAALMVEQDLRGENDEQVDLWVERLTRRNALAEESWFGFTAADRERFRGLRHTLATNVVECVRRNGIPQKGTDYAAPIARSRELIAYYRKRCSEQFPGKYLIFGHIGDANVHLNVLPDSADEARAAEELMLDCAKFALSLGGTVAAEHGIGKNKLDLFQLMYSAEEREAMRAVKRTLDPHWLLGRGTIFEGPES